MTLASDLTPAPQTSPLVLRRAPHACASHCTIAMPPLSKAVTPLVRQWTRHTLPTTQRPATAILTPSVTAATQQRRGRADAQAGSSFDSPFDRSGGTARRTEDIPDFGHYKSSSAEVTNSVFQYFMVGTLGMLTAVGAKNTVQGEFQKAPVLFSSS